MRDVAVVADSVVAIRGETGALGFLRGTVSGMR